MALCFFKHMSSLLLVIALIWLHCLVDANTDGNLEKDSASQTGNVTYYDHSSKDSPTRDAQPEDKEGPAWGTTGKATESGLLDEDESSGHEQSENGQTAADGEHHVQDDHSGTHALGSDKDVSSEHESSKSWQSDLDKEHQNVSAWGSTGNATKSDLLEGMPLDKDAASEGERSRNAGADVDQEHHREDDNSGTYEFGSDKDGPSGRETGKNWQAGVHKKHHKEDGRSGTHKLGGDAQQHKGCRQSQRHSKEKSRNLRGHDGSEGAASMEDEADKQACEEEGLGLWGILGIVGAGLAVVCVCSTLARCFCCKGSSKSGIASITSRPVVVGIPMSNDVELKA